MAISNVVVLAHPLTQRAELPLSALELSLLAVYVVVVVAAVDAWRARSASVTAPRTGPAAEETTHVEDGLPAAAGGPGFWIVRAVALAVFVFTIVAALVGDTSQVRNIAPALTIGAGWPLLTLAALVVGAVWRWLNPFDTLARPVAGLGAGEGSARDGAGTGAPVWWAVAPAALWMAYLTVWPSALDPRTLGRAMVLYALLTLAGCLAVGRRTWLGRGEFFTVFFGLLSSARTMRRRWSPPAGSATVLGVVSGGALFGLFRDSDLGAFIAYGPTSPLYSRLALLLFLALAAAGAEMAARRAAPGAVTVALAPLAAALVVALALARNRLTTSLQLIPIAASNPLGGDLDLFGTRYNGLNPVPLGEVGLVWLQTAVLIVGAAAGLVLARRWLSATGSVASPGAARRTRGVVSLLLGTYLGIAVAAVAAI